METTKHPHSGNILLVAIEMSNTEWKLKMTDLRKDRMVTVKAGNVNGLDLELAKARSKWGLPDNVIMSVCYEAGRDGFWLARRLTRQGIDMHVVDPASIEVPQRHRRVKTDRIDAGKLLDMLKRQVVYGEKPWRVCRIPTEQQEDESRLVREHERLKKERSGHVNRIRSLLVLHGIRIQGYLLHTFNPQGLKTPDGKALEPQLIQEIEREQKRLALVEEQLGILKKHRQATLKDPVLDSDWKARKLANVKGIASVAGTTLSRDFFWRRFRNRREVGSMSGLTGCPYQSGDMNLDQGISKTGNKRIRSLMVELAWGWLRFQPNSELSRWYWKRLGENGKPSKRKLIVAVARKLLVALWKYLEFDEVPAGAVLKAT